MIINHYLIKLNGFDINFMGTAEFGRHGSTNADTCNGVTLLCRNLKYPSAGGFTGQGQQFDIRTVDGFNFPDG